MVALTVADRYGADFAARRYSPPTRTARRSADTYGVTFCPHCPDEPASVASCRARHCQLCGARGMYDDARASFLCADHLTQLERGAKLIAGYDRAMRSPMLSKSARDKNAYAAKAETAWAAANLTPKQRKQLRMAPLATPTPADAVEGAISYKAFLRFYSDAYRGCFAGAVPLYRPDAATVWLSDGFRAIRVPVEYWDRAEIKPQSADGIIGLPAVGEGLHKGGQALGAIVNPHAAAKLVMPSLLGLINGNKAQRFDNDGYASPRVHVWVNARYLAVLGTAQQREGFTYLKHAADTAPLIVMDGDTPIAAIMGLMSRFDGTAKEKSEISGEYH